jgi:hypothetical protein
MLFIVTAVFSGAIGLIRGGRLGNLTELAIRCSALPLIALGLQVFVIYGPGKEDARPFGVSAVLILGSYALLLVAVLVNWRLPGMALIGLGAALNLLVILVNGGWMPVTAEHLAASGIVTTSAAIQPRQRVPFSKDVVIDSHAGHLRWLSDVFVIPKAGMFSTVFSLGDILMVLGLFWLIQFGMVKGARRTDHIVPG